MERLLSLICLRNRIVQPHPNVIPADDAGFARDVDRDGAAEEASAIGEYRALPAKLVHTLDLAAIFSRDDLLDRRRFHAASFAQAASSFSRSPAACLACRSS